MENIAIFFGGSSVEHDISVITGVLTANSLNVEKYLAVPVYVHNDGAWYTGRKLLDLDNYKKLDLNELERVTLINGQNTLYRVVKQKKLKPVCKISSAINCMHGERGEDGSLAGLLNMCEVPLVSPSMLASAVSMDKCFTKTVMKGLKIKTLPFVTVTDIEDVDKVTRKLKFPVIIKPACLGSSIGLYTANDGKELIDGINGALRLGDKVIVEPKLTGYKEINCAVYKKEDGIVVSECERPIGKGELLSFADKYTGGDRVFPADIDESIAERIKIITKKVYTELFFTGVIRIDYFVKDGEIYLNEINSVPGSLAFYLFCGTLREFSSMLDEMLKETKKRTATATTIIRKYNSGILSFSGSKGAKTKKK